MLESDLAKITMSGLIGQGSFGIGVLVMMTRAIIGLVTPDHGG